MAGCPASRRPARQWEVERLRGIAGYQFGEDVAGVLLPDGVRVEVEITGRGSIRYIYVDGERLLTLRPNDGLFSLSLPAASRILRATSPPRLRVGVREGASIRGSVLAPDVVFMDPDLRPGDEVIVVLSSSDKLLGVGRVRIPPVMLEGLERGEVVRIRKRVKTSEG